MVYGIFLVLDQDQWYRDDFSTAKLLTGTIYNDKQLLSAENLTGYTVKIRMARNNRWGDHFGKTATIVSAANGTWSYAVAVSEMPPPGIYNMTAEITQAGIKETTLNRVELHILAGPAG